MHSVWETESVSERLWLQQPKNIYMLKVTLTITTTVYTVKESGKVKYIKLCDQQQNQVHCIKNRA
jgi:hypothetical protein